MWIVRVCFDVLISPLIRSIWAVEGAGDCTWWDGGGETLW